MMQNFNQVTFILCRNSTVTRTMIVSKSLINSNASKYVLNNFKKYVLNY